MVIGVELMRSGVNLVEDAARLAKSKNLKCSYDTTRALVSPRPRFVTIKSDEIAMNRAGFLTDGHVRYAENIDTGMQERISYTGKTVERVLYDKAKNPVGAIYTKFSPDGDSFYSQVLKPSKDGEIMEVMPNGTERPSNYYGETNFAKAFDFKEIQEQVKDFFKF